MSTGVIMGNVKAFGVLTIAVDHGSVSANSTAEKTVTVPGLKTGDFVAVNKPSHESGLGIVNARVSANNTLAIQAMNTTGSAIDEASETYTVMWARPADSVSAVKE